MDIFHDKNTLTGEFFKDLGDINVLKGAEEVSGIDAVVRFKREINLTI